MIAIFLVFGASALAIYGYVCLREGSYINALTPSFAFYFSTSFVFEPLFLSVPTDYQYDVGAFVFVYLCDFANFLGLAVAYIPLIGRRVQVLQPPDSGSRVKNRLGFLSWFFLLISALIFLPVAIEFREYVFADPRRLYELTRIGYGQYLFISVLMLNLSVICFLFSHKRGAILFVPCVLLLSIFKGAKGPTLALFQIYIMWAIYVRGWRIALGKFIVSVAAVALIVTGLFAITLRGVDSSDLVFAIAGYSDYNRHAALTVTEPVGPFFGRLTLENFVYARVPRILVPDKPKDFGIFYLAEHYLPEQFILETGAPAFGAGVFIADFGILTPIFTLCIGLCTGYVLGICVQWLRRGGGIAAFITMLYFAGISLIPIPTAFLGIEHWLMGLVLGKLSRLRLVGRSRESWRSHIPQGNTNLGSKG